LHCPASEDGRRKWRAVVAACSGHTDTHLTAGLNAGLNAGATARANAMDVDPAAGAADGAPSAGVTTLSPFDINCTIGSGPAGTSLAGSLLVLTGVKSDHLSAIEAAVLRVFPGAVRCGSELAGFHGAAVILTGMGCRTW
jgi:hypothetical protein